MIFLTLFYEFFKAGLFAVGGGLATIPFLSAMADKYPWLTHAQLADMIAVGESTPGPIGVNCATYAGFNAAGVPGALVATVSLVLPSYIIITLVARALEKYRDSTLVSSAFAGLRPAAAGLIAAAAWGVMSGVLFDLDALAAGGIGGIFNLPELLLFAALMIVTNIKKLKSLHPLVFIGAAAGVGIIFQM